MNKKNNIFNAVLIIAVIAIMLFPMMQTFYFRFSEKSLSGDVRLETDTELSAQSWFEGNYSHQKEKYFNDNFGFRNFFLKLIDQIYYFAFKAVFAKDVIPGKEGFLYELKYLQTHAGLDFVGNNEIKSRLEKIKFIQDVLEKKGIHFALLFAPGKASYYPEYIPAPYDVSSQTTNYLKYIEEAKSSGTHFIDFNQLFIKLKSSTKHPLYPKTGTHWSIYGMHIAFDTLTKYMERVSNKKLARFDYSNLEITDSLRYPDGDIADGLNLFFDPPHFKMAYPILKWTDTVNAYKPCVLTISDSYWMGIYFLGLPQKEFSNPEFWYYNKQLFNYDPSGKTTDPADFDLKEAVEKNNFIFIMATEASLRQIGWGFIEEVYDMYKCNPEEYETFKLNRKRNAEIIQIKILIHNEQNWYNRIVLQAKEINISVDSCIQQNADYVYYERHKNDVIVPQVKSYDQKVLEFKKIILSDPAWMNKVSQKAKKWGISIDSVILNDAKWMVDENIKNE